ncbi:hypothetical protein ACJJTC_006329 [Scirpophaga incertulas]
MGNVVSSGSTRVRVTSESAKMNNPSSSSDQDGSDITDDVFVDANEEVNRAKMKEDEMIEFKKELSLKREQRRQILARHKAEKQDLENSLTLERKSRLELCETNHFLRELLLKNNIEIPDYLQTCNDNSELVNVITQMREEFENLKANNNKLRTELANSNIALQNANTDIAELNTQSIESMKQIGALKEVVTISKTMVALREQQLNELKAKLSEIEKSLADRETSMLSTNLREEYERQLQNIRTLRGLYEERARLAEVTRQSLVRELDEQKLLNESETNKSKTLTDKVKELEAKVETLIETIHNKNHQINECETESLGLKAEMAVVNKLFSEVLLGYKTKKDLDTLANRLEENHGILTQMAERENDSEASTALPKLLLEIVNQVEEQNENKNAESIQNDQQINIVESESGDIPGLPDCTSTTTEEIVQKLPKVWRVLMELLSHQNVAESSDSEKVTTCYKSVETNSGPVLVPSVSQTYIRLKDLIVEKLTLIKEVNRMKQLNSHLETRLGEQERRLCLVTTELSKTWHVVGRLRRHHHQLHTHEKILKYELQQKRKLLNELKEELEYCREKWEQAREKNTQSEKDWKKLRAEFSSRKVKSGSPSFNHSAESGYSDERASDDSSESNDESEYITEPLIRCKKKIKKSFETILDSSTDHNLVAEREDPVSDMLDVADLPLDTHDESHSESILKSEIFCEETEDEVGDLAIDSCNDDTHPGPVCEVTTNSLHLHVERFTNSHECEINIKSKNEKEATNDIKVETSGSSSINKGEYSSEESHKSTSIYQHNISDKQLEAQRVQVEHTDKIIESGKQFINGQNTLVNYTSDSSSSISRTTSDPPLPNIDFQAILNNIKKQDERLAKKDKRLEQLESDCSEVVSSINSTLETGKKLNKKIDSMHSAHNKTKDLGVKDDESCADNINECESEPSTSAEIDHEARFAARDLRLKKLEEQTKSLVNKVNKTTSKGVKIHYKLEELHNIYGSENSRSGTPSDDTDEKSTEEDPPEDKM